jgi:hypothetical protein
MPSKILRERLRRRLTGWCSFSEVLESDRTWWLEIEYLTPGMRSGRERGFGSQGKFLPCKVRVATPAHSQWLVAFATKA